MILLPVYMLGASLIDISALAQDRNREPASASPRTYYVSSSMGSDDNEGLTESAPWKSLDRLYVRGKSPGFQAGDRILLRRGDSWQGEISIDCQKGTGGTQAAPVRIGAYGSGPNPEILGDSAALSWSEVEGVPGVYRAELGAGGSIFAGYSAHIGMKGGIGQDKLADPGRLKAALLAMPPNSFGPVGGRQSVVYVRTLTSGSPVYPETVMFRHAGVSITGCRYFSVQDLTIKKFSNAVELAGTDHVEVRNLQVEDTIGIGIYLRTVNSYALIEGNTTDRTGNDAIYVLKSAHTVVRGNKISHILSEILGFSTTGDQAAIGLQESEDDLVEKNTITYVKGGIDFYFEKNSVVRSNFIFHALGFGTPHGTDLEVYDNIVNVDPPNYGNGVNVVNTGQGRISVHDNTFYGASVYGLQSDTPNQKGPVEFRNNIVYARNSKALMVKFAKVVVADQNCYFAPQMPRFWYRSKFFPDFSTYQTDGGREAHSLFADPGFVEPGAHPDGFKLSLNSPCRGHGARF